MEQKMYGVLVLLLIIVVWFTITRPDRFITYVPDPIYYVERPKYKITEFDAILNHKPQPLYGHKYTPHMLATGSEAPYVINKIAENQQNLL